MQGFRYRGLNFLTRLVRYIRVVYLYRDYKGQRTTH